VAPKGRAVAKWFAATTKAPAFQVVRLVVAQPRPVAFLAVMGR
jgi:hypothetical protein